MESQALKGRIALVTGGTTGLGLGAAERLVEEGATVYITGRRKDVLDAAAENLGTSATGIRADVTSRSDMLHVAETIKAAHGHLDILFANAGGGHATPLAELTEEQIDSELDVFDFALTRDKVAAIDALDTGVRGGPDPDSLDLDNAGFPIPD